MDSAGVVNNLPLHYFLCKLLIARGKQDKKICKQNKCRCELDKKKCKQDKKRCKQNKIKSELGNNAINYLRQYWQLKKKEVNKYGRFKTEFFRLSLSLQ